MPHFAANDPTPDPDLWWPVAFLALLLYMTLAVWLAPKAKGDPVPEPKVEARPPNGTRGQPELLDPTAYARPLVRLLRSCTRCHGETGPNKTLFDTAGLPLWNVPKERLRWGVNVVLSSGREARWYPDQDTRRDLWDAIRWLNR